MRLREAAETEVSLLTRMSTDAFHTDYLVGGDANDGPPDYDSELWHEQMRREGHLFAFENNENEMIGGAILFSGTERVYVGRVFIAPDYHGKGCGYSLMLEIERMFPEIKRFELDTPIVNRRTNSLYRKLGYVETGRDAESISYRKTIE